MTTLLLVRFFTFLFWVLVVWVQLIGIRMGLSLCLGLGLDLTPEDWDELDRCLYLRRKDWDRWSWVFGSPISMSLTPLRFAPDRAARIAALSGVFRIFTFKKKAS